MRVTVINPGFTHSELTDRGGDPDVMAAVAAASAELGLPAAAVAHSIAQSDAVDVNEIVVRSTVQG